MASIKGSCTLFLFLQLKIDTFLFILTNPLTFKHTLGQIRLDSVKAQNSAQKSLLLKQDLSYQLDVIHDATLHF